MAKYLSRDMHTKIFDERYKPKALKNKNSLHAALPASHWVVIRQPTSRGIITKVTMRSAAARWVISRLTRDFLCLARRRVKNTDKFPIAATLNSTQYTVTTARALSANPGRLWASTPSEDEVFTFPLSFVLFLL